MFPEYYFDENFIKNYYSDSITTTFVLTINFSCVFRRFTFAIQSENDFSCWFRIYTKGNRLIYFSLYKLLCSFCFLQNASQITEKLQAENKIIVLDHHKSGYIIYDIMLLIPAQHMPFDSAMDDLQGMKDVFFDMNKSGARLVCD